MRTTTKLCLVISLVAAFGLASVPVANAEELPGSVDLPKGISSSKKSEKKQNKKIKKARKRAERAHDRINNIKEWNTSLSEWNNSQQQSIDSLQGTVNAIVAGVPAITDALLALQAALEGPVTQALKDLEDGLLDIQDALEDPTTGLVGLNLARPQFGVFLGTGAFQGGTGPPNSPFGPSGDAFRPAAGTYVVDFGNDVSTRVYNGQPFPTGGVPLIASVVSCNTPGAHQAACDADPDGDPRVNEVFVLLQTGAGAPTDGAFSVTAFSG